MKLHPRPFLFALFGLIFAATTGRAADLDLIGSYTYSTQNSNTTAIITADRVENKTNGGISGTVRLELWAFSSAYTGSPKTGYRLATHSLGQISGNTAKINISSGTVNFTPPPAGTWYLTLMVTEYTNGGSNDGYTTRDYGNFAQTLVIGGGNNGGNTGAQTNLDFSGNYSWEAQNGNTTAILRVDRVTNNSTGGTSGSLRLELWATSSAYTGGSISGYKLAQHGLTPLSAGSSWVNVSSGTVNYTPPPTGSWFVTLVLTEYSSTTTGNDGYSVRDYGNFPDKLIIGNGGNTGGNTGTDLTFSGTYSYTPQNSNTSVVLAVGRIDNNANGGRSGSLRLELWASTSTYGGGTLSGYKLAQYNLDPLNGGTAWVNVSSGTIPFTPPPNGTWQITLALTEYSSTTTGNDGYSIRDYGGFTTPMVIGGGTPTGSAPTITSQPQSQTVAPGGNAYFSVSATGTSPLSYQWRKDGVNLAGATSATLTLTGVQAGNAGSYTVVVSNSYGSATSNAATLTVSGNTTPGTGNVAAGSPVAAGRDHALFLKSDGTLWAAGYNSTGALGNGNTTDQSTPVQVATGVAVVAGGNAHTAFVKTDGTLWTTGVNNNGQLGNGTTASRSTPGQVATGVTSVAAGSGHTAFIKSDNTLWTVGYNYVGQLGNGTRTDLTTPVQVATNVAQVGANVYSTYFVKKDGTLWYMGNAFDGGLGPIDNFKTAPTQVTTGVASVSVGEGHLLFVKTDGTLWAMGENDYGQFGDGSTLSRSSPVQVATGVVAAAAGFRDSYYLKQDGTLWGAGLNYSGELGLGHSSERHAWTQITTNVANVSAGNLFVLFTKKDGTFWTIGRNDYGQLGNGNKTSQSSPVQVLSGGGSGTGQGAPATTQRVNVGQTASFSVNTGNLNPLSVRWQFNGTDTNSYGGSLSVTNVQPDKTGLYVPVNTTNGATLADPMIVGIATTSKYVGTGSEVGANIVHPNGNIFDQVLPAGSAITLTADANQVTRASFLDLDDDIVQVEFSGAGTLSLVLRYASGPELPSKYNQAVSYMKGVAGIVITGANETTNVSVFSVGRATAVNQALFKAGTTYGGVADLAYIAISSTNGKFGGIRAANASFLTIEGPTGIYAPGIQFNGPVFVGNICAADTATPYLLLGSAGDVRITGGSLLQLNSRPVQVNGITQLKFAAGQDSHGNPFPAQPNQAVLQQNGVNVTSQIVVNPTP